MKLWIIFLLQLTFLFSLIAKAQDWRYVKNKKVYINLEEAIKEKDNVFNLQLSRRNVNEKLLHFIGEMKNIQYLSISGAGLDSIPDAIFNLPNVRTLNLTNNKFKVIPDGIRKLLSLEYLVMYDNEITELPGWIGELKNLEELILPRNKIDSISPVIGKLGKLIYLSLGENQLKYLPKEIGNLSNLEELYLNENQLLILPDEINQLTKLKGLYLNDNQLQRLPEVSPGLTGLKVLHLPANQFREVSVLNSLDSLVVFTINNNPLNNWNKNVRLSQKLELLEISGNGIHDFPACLQECKRLKKLVITHTSIKNIPEWIGGFKMLYWLELDDNKITTLPVTLASLNKCEVLKISNNSIDTIYENIILLPKLRVLDISNNPVRHIPYTLTLSKSLGFFNIVKTNITNEEYKRYRKITNKTVGIPHDKLVYFEDEENQCYTEMNNWSTDKTFTKLHIDPFFIHGGVAWKTFVSEHADFAGIIRSAHDESYTICDTVTLKFIVRKAGGVSNIMPVIYKNENAKTESIRLLKLSCPYWVPSHINGRNIHAWVHQSFVFTVTRSGDVIKSTINVFNPLPGDF